MPPNRCLPSDSRYGSSELSGVMSEAAAPHLSDRKSFPFFSPFYIDQENFIADGDTAFTVWPVSCRRPSSSAAKTVMSPESMLPHRRKRLSGDSASDLGKTPRQLRRAEQQTAILFIQSADDDQIQSNQRTVESFSTRMSKDILCTDRLSINQSWIFIQKRIHTDAFNCAFSAS